MVNKKNVIFGIDGKIFCYQNNINSVRIVLAIYYNILDSKFEGSDENNLNMIEELSNENTEEDEDEDENANLKK